MSADRPPLMARLSLRAQMTLLLALGLLLAQAINFGLQLDQRRAVRAETVVNTAAARLAHAASLPPERAARRMRRQARRAIAAPASGPRLPALEAAIESRLEEDFGLSVRGVRVVELPSRAGGAGRLLASASLRQGGLVSVRVRGVQPIGPLLARLVIQTLVIFAALLIPLLWLAGRAARPLERLTRAARAWRPGVTTPPLTLAGPSDVRELIVAIGGMQGRIDGLLTEKDVMLGAIGHDLRTPLTALRLQTEAVEDEAVRGAMLASLERLSGDLESILALARSARALSDPQPIDLDALVEAIVAERRHAGEAVTLSAAEPARIAGDAASLRRVLDNLLDNAIRYGVRAQVTVERTDGGVAVSVRDDGPGLSPEALERAGEPFVRFEESRNRATGGHGLGLAIARAIAERHGGSLTLANAQGGGLVARLVLPLAPEAA